MIAKANACANVKPKVKPKSTILPNSIKAVAVYSSPAPALINSNTKTATKAPIGSIKIPSHFKTAETSFLSGIFLRIGEITVGPVTIINAANKKDTGQFKLNKKYHYK